MDVDRVHPGATESESPLLITLGLDACSFQHLDGLRKRYFPAERNFIHAHISLLHQLPPSCDKLIKSVLGDIASSRGSIPLRFSDAFRLGSGFAVRVESSELMLVHRELVAQFEPWLTPQDRQPFRPHVTIMNKAERDRVPQAFAEFQSLWQPYNGTGVSLLLWRYLGGPWEFVDEFTFATHTTGLRCMSEEG